MRPSVKNWSGNVSFRPRTLLCPDSEAEIQERVCLAAAQHQGLRLVGAAHSFTPLIATSELLVSLDHWLGLERIELDRQRVWVRAGTRLRLLNRLLDSYGLALANLGDIDHQSIAGAISTGTHGTGLGLQNLSAQVAGLRLITADGQLHQLEPGHPWFEAACVSLGTLGVISAVALKVVPAYRLRLELRQAHLQDVLEQLDELLAQHRHLEFFVFPGSPYVQLKLTDITQAPPTSRWKQQSNEFLLENLAFWGLSEISRRVPGSTRGVARLCGLAISDQVQIDQSYRIFANHRWTRFEEMEYAVPLPHFKQALQEVLQLIETQQHRVHFPIECRFAQADTNWLSPGYQRDNGYIALHQYQGMPWEAYFKSAETVFAQYQGRPHWGKQHFLQAAELATRYPQWAAFLALRQQLDPEGMFVNPYLQGVLGL